MLRIVLVEPREAGNVGAAARVMKNFGFSALAIVGEHPELLPVAGWWASGADDVLAGATYAGSLLEAIGDAHVTVATTSLRGRTPGAGFDPFSLAGLFHSLRGDQTMALVFGREDRGLTGEEVALCQHTAAITTDPRFPTMNLAQAVGAFCLALSGASPAPRERELPAAAMVERMHQRVRALLLDTGFLQANSPDHIYDALRAIAARADLDEREVTIVLGIVRQLEWALGRRGQS